MTFAVRDMLKQWFHFLKSWNFTFNIILQILTISVEGSTSGT
jgi:hypothetical protein